MIFLPKPLLSLSVAIVAVAGPSATNPVMIVGAAVAAAEVPTPLFEVNFSDPDSVTDNTMNATAEVSTGPGGVDALRIDECGKRSYLPVDVNPTVMPNVTMVLGIHLTSIATYDYGSKTSFGWALSSDNGGFDRSIVMHDYRFKGMGMPSGSAESVWYTDKEGEPPLNEWLHVVAVYSETMESQFGIFYVNGQPAPFEIPVNNGEGDSKLVVGTNMLYEGWSECSHWTDSWIKEVQIYDSVLSSDDVSALNKTFHETVGSGQEDNGDSSSDEDEDDTNLFEDLIDLVMGSSAHTVVAANGMTTIALIGIMMVF